MFRTVFNGLLIQEKDKFINDFDSFEVVTQKKPNKNAHLCNELLLISQFTYYLFFMDTNILKT